MSVEQGIVKSFLESLHKETSAFLMEMASTEDWVISSKDDGHERIFRDINVYTKEMMSIDESYLAIQIMGWVSAPHCLMILRDLSKEHPDMVRSIFMSNRQDEVTEMVVERLKVLEKFAQLRRLLDPRTIRSIERGMLSYARRMRRMQAH